jgi:type IV pilus assembly protein PilO
MSKPQQMILGSLAGILLVMLLTNLLFKPLLRKKRDLKVQYKALEVDLMRKAVELQEAQAATLAPGLDAIEAKYRYTRQKLEYFQGQLPQDKQIPLLLSQIASQAQLDYNLIRLLPEESKLVYKVIPIQVQIKGTYRDMGEYLKKLEEAPRPIRVKSLAIKPDDKTPLRLEAKLEVATYIVK